LARGIGLAFFSLIAALWFLSAAALDIETPRLGLTDVPMDIAVTGVNAGSVVAVTVGEQNLWATADAEGRVVVQSVTVVSTGPVAITANLNGETAFTTLRVLPGWISLMPAFLAIAVALLLRNVVPALLVGLWLGATALQSFSASGAWKGLLDVFATFIADAMADADRAAIILFTMMIGGMVGIVTRNGGMSSVVRMIVSRAKTAVGAQVSVWLMGLMIFFDDYANTLVVGNTARPLTDQLKVSREKLAYIVDSTAAPVVCLALVTTWIGYEVSLIDRAIEEIQGFPDVAAYSVFLSSIPYSFYPILAVLFVLAVAATGRDMGPMYKAEVRARNGQVEPHSTEELPALEGDTLDAKDNIPLRAANAFVPIIVMIVGLGVGLYVTGRAGLPAGEAYSIREIIGEANAYQSMMWASFVGALTAATMSIAQRILSAHETVDAWYGGARATPVGMIVLVLAWAVSG